MNSKNNTFQNKMTVVKKIEVGGEWRSWNEVPTVLSYQFSKPKSHH